MLKKLFKLRFQISFLKFKGKSRKSYRRARHSFFKFSAPSCA